MGLYAAYAFNEGSGSTIIDYSGNGFDMTVFGSVSWVTGHGSYANAFQSGTSTSDGAYYNPASAIAALAGDVTVMLWYKSTAGTDNECHAGGLYGGPGSARSSIWPYRDLFIAASPECTVRDSGDDLFSIGVDGSHSDASWHHCAFVYHSSGLMEQYLDGSLVFSDTPTSNPIGSNVNYIGVGSILSGGTNEAVVQDLRVFDSALTSTEVTTYMNTPVVGGTPHTATASLTVTPLFTAARTRGTFRSGSLTVTPTTAAARTRAAFRAATLTVTPSTDAARTLAQHRSASLTVDPSLTAARLLAHTRTAQLDVTPTLTATSTQDHVRTASLTVTPSFSAASSATGAVAHTATAGLTVGPSFTAAASRTAAVAHTSTAGLLVAPSFTAARTAGHTRSAALAVDPAFTAARTAAFVRSAGLVVTPDLAVTAHRTGVVPSVPLIITAGPPHGRWSALPPHGRYSAGEPHG